MLFIKILKKTPGTYVYTHTHTHTRARTRAHTCTRMHVMRGVYPLHSLFQTLFLSVALSCSLWMECGITHRHCHLSLSLISCSLGLSDTINLFCMQPIAGHKHIQREKEREEESKREREQLSSLINEAST